MYNVVSFSRKQLYLPEVFHIGHWLYTFIIVGLDHLEQIRDLILIFTVQRGMNGFMEAHVVFILSLRNRSLLLMFLFKKLL